MLSCPYCGHDHAPERCERAFAVEHAADGRITRIEAVVRPLIIAARKPFGIGRRVVARTER